MSDRSEADYKAGKLPARVDPRGMKLGSYLSPELLEQVPEAVDWSTKKASAWGMLGNWKLCDCTCAAAGHMIECWTANASREHHVRNEEVLQAFIALSHYDPVTGKNDNPVEFTAALNYWRKHGIGTHRIKAYTTVDYHDRALVRAAIFLFGGAYVGLNMPKSFKGQEIWDVKPGRRTGDAKAGSFGGHAVNVIGYDEQYLTCVTWGKLQRMTWAFWDAYCDELFAIITEDFLRGGRTPLGFDLGKLEADLLCVTKAPRSAEKQLAKSVVVRQSAKAAPAKGAPVQVAGESGQSGRDSGEEAAKLGGKTAGDNSYRGRKGGHAGKAAGSSGGTGG